MPQTTVQPASSATAPPWHHPAGGAPTGAESRVHQAIPDSAVRGAAAANTLIVVNTALRASATLIIMPLMVAALGQQLYGLWITVSTITMYLSLSESGIGQTIVNQVGKAYTLGRHRRIGEIVATAHVLYWMMVLPVLAVAVTLILALPVGNFLLRASDAHYEPLLKTCLVLATVLALVRIPFLVFPGVLIGVRRLPLRVGWEIGGTLFTLAATAAALAIGAGLVGVTIVVNLALLGATVAICVSTARLGDWARLRFSRFRPSLLRVLATNSGFFFLVSAAGVVDRSLAVLLVPRFVSLAAAPPFFLLTSVFRVAAFAFIAALPRAVQPYVVMWTANHDTGRAAAAAKLLTKASAVLASLAIACFAPFAEAFVDVWLGADCYPGTVVLSLIAGAFLVDALSCTPVHFLIAMNRQRALSLLLLAKAALTAVLAVALASSATDPLVGIAAGAFAASVLAGFGVPCLIRPALGIRWRAYAEHFLARPLAHAALTPVVVAAAASPLTLEARCVVVAPLAALGVWCGWRLVFDADDRALVQRALAQLRPKSRQTS